MNCKWCANPETILPFPQLLFHQNKCSGCGRCLDACSHQAITSAGGKITLKRNKCIDCGTCTDVCLNGARELVGIIKTPEEVFEIVNQDKVFYQQSSGGGVTFSGGESLLHADYIRQVASKCKAEGYSVAIETCGYFKLSQAQKVMDLVDYLLFDIKLIDDEKHIKYCRKSNKTIHENFDALVDLVEVIPRVPIIPGINDTPADLALLCDFFDRYRKQLDKIHILPYHNLGRGKYDALGQYYELDQVKPPTKEYMEGIKELMEAHGFKVTIGG